MIRNKVFNESKSKSTVTASFYLFNIIGCVRWASQTNLRHRHGRYLNVITYSSQDFIYPQNGDVDDVGALCAAHGLEQLGEAQIFAVGNIFINFNPTQRHHCWLLVHNVGYPRSIGAVSVINHYYGRDDIVLGAFKGEFGKNHSGKMTSLKWLWTGLKCNFRSLYWWSCWQFWFSC